MTELLDNRRCIFISASFLSKQYKALPGQVLENSIFFFNAQRSWLFPKNSEEMVEAKTLAPKYLEFDDDFKALIRQKEEQNLVYWFRPDKAYQKLSAFLEQIVDPTSNEMYLPLLLDEAWWQSEFSPADSKYTRDANSIVQSLKTRVFDDDTVMELLYQSNPTMVPTLYWAETES